MRACEILSASVCRRAVSLLCIFTLLAALSCSDDRTSTQGKPLSPPSEYVPADTQPLTAEIVSPGSPHTLYQGRSLSFHGRAEGGGKPYSFRWDFSGAAGAVNEKDTGEVIFSRPGSYDVVFEVVDAGEAVARDTLTITVIEDVKPVVRIDSPSEASVSIREGDKLDFRASALGGNEPLTFEWDFGQGSKPSAGRQATGIVFPKAGAFTVTVTVRDDNGDTARDSVVVEVARNVPAASIVSPKLPQVIFKGRSVAFAGQAAGGNGPFAFSWDFGGGAEPLSVRDPGEVLFMKPGTFEVTFTVTDTHGDRGTDFTTVKVLDDTKPAVKILNPQNKTGVSAGKSLDFQAVVTGGDEPVRVWWDFQEAAPGASVMSPGHVTFTVPGIYRVTFRAVDATGDAAEDSVQVEVLKDTVPTVSIPDLPEKVFVTRDGTVLFRGEVSGGEEPLEYLWRFGGASPEVKSRDAGEIAFHAEGTFPVSLTVTDADGDTATASVQVVVVEDTQPSAIVELPQGDVEIYEGESVVFRGSSKDGNEPLRFKWDFHGGAKNSDDQAPGEVVFAKAGVYPVTFTVKDHDGDTDSVTRSVTVIKSSWACVSGGWSHSAGIKTDGSLWAWGLNSYGQVGSGNSAGIDAPVMIGLDKDWLKAAAGGAHTLAIKEDGTLWAWGANGTGQLGNRSRKHAYSPVKIMADARWREIAAGKSHSLGIQADGSLWAWGRNAEGQLGNGTRTPSDVPVPIGVDKDWKYVAAGEAHSIAVKNDGSLWAWGSNELGQIGDGSRTDSPSPRRIGSGDTWAAIAAGRWHSLAIKSDGTLWAWGGNIWGQLGDGTKAYKVSPVEIGNDCDWKMIAAGEYHSLALKRDGSLWCWGWNTFGQLGMGNTRDRRHPSRVGLDEDWSFVSAGDHHSLGVRTGGALWGWGYNGYGQLGDGTAEDRDIPVLIRPPREKRSYFGIPLPAR